MSRLFREFKVSSIWLALLCACFAGQVEATRVSADERPDPFIDGASCEGYRYLSPPRYEKDELQLGLVEHNWTMANVWFCPDSGYASYGFDFDISGVEKQRLSRYLDEISGLDFKQFSKLEQFVWMERLYKIRGRGPGFWSTFYRAMYRNLGEVQRSHAAGRALQAFKDNREELEGNPFQLFGMATLFSKMGWHREACVCYMQGQERFMQLVEEGSVSGASGVSLLRVYSAVRERVLMGRSSCATSSDEGESVLEAPTDARCGDVLADF